MPIDYIDNITERYRRLGYTPYRWHVADQSAAWAPLAKPMANSKLGVLSTAGGYVVGQRAYHYKDDTLFARFTATRPMKTCAFPTSPKTIWKIHGATRTASSRCAPWVNCSGSAG